MGSTASKPSVDKDDAARARMFRSRRVPFLARLAVLLPWRTPLRRVSPRAPRVGLESMDSVGEMRAAMAAMGGWGEREGDARGAAAHRRRRQYAFDSSQPYYNRTTSDHSHSHYSSSSAHSGYSSAVSTSTAYTAPTSPPRSNCTRTKRVARPRPGPYRRSWGSYAADYSDVSDAGEAANRYNRTKRGVSGGGLNGEHRRFLQLAADDYVGVEHDGESDVETVWESAVESLVAA